MIKVFLVEDEVVIRNGIRNNIPWEKEGFQFVGEASDGELAYPMIKKEKPDLLITDIKMPFMDGLELSRIVKKELPQIKIIILSGYNEFDYAKTAIDIGVTEFLLKPVSSVRLLETMKKVGRIISEEQEQSRLVERYQKETEANLQLEKFKLWNSLIYNQLSTAELLENGQKLGLDFAASVYLVLLFKVMQEETPPLESPSNPSTDLVEISERIMELSACWPHVLTFDRNPEGWVFVIKDASDELAETALAECTRELVRLVSEYPRINYFGGIGSMVHRLSDIRSSYQTASKAFSGRFFTETNQILSCEDLPSLHSGQNEKIDVTAIRSKKSERELVEKFLKSGSPEEVDSFLEEYFLNVGGVHFHSLLYRQYVIMDLFFAATDFLCSLDIEPEKLPPDCQDINLIVEKSSSRKSAQVQIGRLFQATIQLRNNRSRKKYHELLEEACDFIRENYQREDMSLNTVASQVNISPSYFSSIFSSETGQTFVEYLTTIRLDRAKELLVCSGLRTAEIAYEVGYKDPHYFSYIFKKIVGCSPTEYKNRGRKQET